MSTLNINDIFKINKDFQLNVEIFNGSSIYTIDNFYQNPDSILDFFLNTETLVHKKNEKPSYNQIYFDDLRHSIECNQSNNIDFIYDFLGNLCKQTPISSSHILTNITRFKYHNFNDYVNNYWWPHKDHGYNAIIYFNKNDDDCGTNLYLNMNPREEPPKCPEHFCPWRKKSNFKLIKSLTPKFNRMIMFDGLKFYHGMNICNNYYFKKEYRLNQVLFFQKNKNYTYN
jgi:hypothetical protein